MHFAIYLNLYVGSTKLFFYYSIISLQPQPNTTMCMQPTQELYNYKHDTM
jgi:hypothetical protein